MKPGVLVGVLFLLGCTLCLGSSLFGDLRGDGPDLHSVQWQAMSAADKDATIWSYLSGDTTPGDWYSYIQIGEIFVESASTTFEYVGDDMPKQGPFDLVTRKKLIHTVGPIAKVEFVSNGNHPYTGLFTGASYGYMRFSPAKKPDPTAEKGLTCGLSIKWLRDGVPSANAMAMYSLEGQSSFNFFEHDLTNHVPTLGPNAPIALKLLAKKFATASAWPSMVGIADWARFTQDGKLVENVVSPYRLIYHPTTQVHKMFPSKTDQTLGEQLAVLQPGTTIYEVFAVDKPYGTPVSIGVVNLKTSPTSSYFGDRALFFEHSVMEYDFSFHNEWIAGAKQELEEQSQKDYWVYPDLPWN